MYDWSPYQEICHRLYVDEGKSTEEIMGYLKKTHNFAPSKRTVHTQFKKWGLLVKQQPTYNHNDLVSRIKELWDQNLNQSQMLKVLKNEDGFDIKSRDITRIRVRNGWQLRAAGGDRREASEQDEREASLLEATSDAAPAENGARERSDSPESIVEDAQKPPSKRSQRSMRRGNGTGPVGAEVRYPSEMTMEEGRRILGLDLAAYRDVSGTFQRICRDEGVVKKTLAGPEKWETVKSRLVQTLPQLHAANTVEGGKLALEVMCSYITKCMRVRGKRMTLSQAKNVLGVNPDESREMRIEFHRIAAERSITFMSDATPRQWREMKRLWARRSALVRKIMQELGPNPDSHVKGRALDLVARDVIKRIRGDIKLQEKRDSQRSTSATGRARVVEQKLANAGDDSQTEEDPANDESDDLAGETFDTASQTHTSQVIFSPENRSMTSSLGAPIRPSPMGLSNSRANLHMAPRALGSSMPMNMQMDSRMDASLLLGPHASAAYMDGAYAQQPFAGTASTTGVFPTLGAVSTACAVYFRLHPSSTFPANATLWIATLSSHSVQELRNTATERYPGAACARIDGMVKDGKGHELPLPIVEDQELGAYLTHLQGAAPTFSVELVWKSS
ncbi:hypothetical protein HIM_03087 [Hirsutella minnesotensis 3608]|nr:hypothetical protein HIM_03087 [Hirsutella minnesotensis 3608]